MEILYVDGLPDWNGVSDYESLGKLMGLSKRTVSHALHNKEDLLSKIVIQGRTVYRSFSSLKRVQKKLTSVLGDLFDTLPGKEFSLAYVKGKCAVRELRDYAGYGSLVKTDLRHYYDNISMELIERVLTELGFNPNGARLISRLTTVWNGKFHSLQQGSACSPVMANIVGNVLFDRKIADWLEANYKDAKYIRYSDNISVFFKEKVLKEDYRKVKDYIKGLMYSEGFKTHMWSNTWNCNPHVAQTFIGVVLNKEAGYPKKLRKRLRSVLVNVATAMDPVREMCRYMNLKDEQGFGTDKAFLDSLNRAFFKSIDGMTSYIGSINQRQGTELKKMAEVARLRMELFKDSDDGFKLGSKGVEMIRSATDRNENFCNFEKRLSDCILS